MPNQSQFKTTNYMVPSSGQTHAVVFAGNFSGSPYLVDWRQYAIDNEPFQPQGVFMDNTQGTTPLVINIMPINYTVTCPVGKQLQAQFPAPNGQTAQITGDPANTATVIFVDFPVLPSTNQTSIVGMADVNLLSANPAAAVTTNPPAMTNAGLLPYRAQEYVAQPEFHSLHFSGATKTASVVPTLAQQNLRKLQVSITGDATLAAAADIVLTATLNGVLIFSRYLSLGVTAITGAPPAQVVADLDFSSFAPNAAAGNLTVALSTALATGSLDAAAYFTPQ